MVKTNLAFLILISAAKAQINYPAIPGKPLLFNDTFENDNSTFSWTTFEEVVNACANTGVGAVIRNTTVWYQGRGSLAVRSNVKQVPGSNHVLAQRKLSNVGVTGRFIYSTYALVDPSILPMTQTGPEFSLQSTFPVGLTRPQLNPTMRTMIGGLQYVGNSFVTNKWNLWARTSPSSTTSESAAWVNITRLPNIVSAKGWWKLTLAMDFAQSKYLYVELVSPTQNRTKVDLTAYNIAREVKFSGEGVSATLEAQNLYDCKGVHVHDAFYDNVNLQQTVGIVPLPVTVPAKTSTVFAGASDTWILPTTLLLYVLQAPTKGTVQVFGNSTITYKATSPGGDSIKIKACDKTTFQCTETWWTIVSNNRAPIATAATTRFETSQCGTILSIPSPITDPDMNLNVTSAKVISGTARVDLSMPGKVGFLFNLTGKTGKGEVGFQVQVCDVKPWAWCATAWIVVGWICPL